MRVNGRIHSRPVDAPAGGITEGAGVVGGYLLHSPAARRLSARLASAHTLVIAGVIGFIAVKTDRLDTVTVVYLIAMVAWTPIVPLLPAERLSHHAMAKLYLVGIGSFFFFAFHFHNPYLLIGAYPESIALADVYWYRRSLLVLHSVGLFGGLIAAALLIGGHGAMAVVLVAAPLMATNALIVGSSSHRFILFVLERKQFQTTVTSLLEALQARDGYTRAHSQETLSLAMAVADEIELDDDARKELADVSLLHDIGKIGIPNSILQKPGKLTEDEWAVMRQHPVVGEQILADVPGFENVARAVRHEHERWDGNGYPDGIAGEDIPLASRIVLACDAFHAMTSDRPYRSAMPIDEALGELCDNAGSQFDPRIAAALCAVIERGWDRESAAADVEPASLIDPDVTDVSSGSAFELPSAPAPALEAEEPLSDRRTTARGMATGWAYIAVTFFAYRLASGPIDLFGVALPVFAVAIAATCWSLRDSRVANPVCFVAGLLAYAAGPIAAMHCDEIAMFVLPLGPAVALAAYFWNRIALRVFQFVLVISEFVVLPVVMFGAKALPFAAVSTRAFPGVLLMIGYFFERLVEMRFERRRFSGTMTSLLLALHARDGYTGEHSDQTVALAMRVAAQLGLEDADRMELKDVAMLHDIGKIGIPDEILNKPGKLSEDEWKTMRLHPVIGEQIVGRVPGFESVARAIRHEHERWDGHGYPDGLRGEEIPLTSRIVLACDAYHAMTSDRPYRRSLGERTARKELISCAGSQFDPLVVGALLDVLNVSQREAEEQVVEAPPGLSAIG